MCKACATAHSPVHTQKACAKAKILHTLAHFFRAKTAKCARAKCVQKCATAHNLHTHTEMHTPQYLSEKIKSVLLHPIFYSITNQATK
jgi:hypothetical protein